jgi:hypothetical protein
MVRATATLILAAVTRARPVGAAGTAGAPLPEDIPLDALRTSPVDARRASPVVVR